jgi:hypothetical protein
MATIISTQKSKETLERLIRDAFYKVDTELDYIYNESETLIKTAMHYGLFELAEELKNI